MLLQFSVENYRSFRDRVELNMRASPHVQKAGPHAAISESLRILRCASIYGANASGKSNLIHALRLVQRMVTSGPPAKEAVLRVEPFRLAQQALDSPTRMELYILVEGETYGYSFAATSAQIVHERLCKVDPATGAETVLFERSPGGVEFSAKARQSVEDPKFLDYVARGTKHNQLLLSEAHEREVSLVEPIQRWFREALKIIEPGSRFVMLEDFADTKPEFREHLRQVLGWADTGIVGLTTERSLLDERVAEAVDRLLEYPDFRALVRAMPSSPPRRGAIRRMDDGRYEEISLVSHHRGERELVAFDLDDESDGTIRLMDLAPMLYFARELNNVVFVVDELDRSLHTLLAQELVRRFVETLPESGAATTQLLFTTHDTNLLDCGVLGHDCVWFTEKDRAGSSTLYSLADFAPEQLAALEGALERGYLKGRFGGIPFVGDPRRLAWPAAHKGG